VGQRASALITAVLVTTSVVGWDGKNTWTPRGLIESGDYLNYAVRVECKLFAAVCTPVLH